MRHDNAAIPAGMAWSSPFARWQGSLAEMSSLEVAADLTATALGQRGVDPGRLDGLILGWTIPQPGTVLGASALAEAIGAPGITGPMISQSCTTSVACLAAAAGAVTTTVSTGAGGTGAGSTAMNSTGTTTTVTNSTGAEGGGLWLVVTADRTSNGPTLHFPAPSAPGGAPVVTNWVLDGLPGDGVAAEKAAADCGITRERLDELADLRFGQYAAALAGDRGFQRRYMVPVRTPDGVIAADEGAGPTGSRRTQTHPADGAAGAIVTTVERARELARGDGVTRILATGFAGTTGFAGGARSARASPGHSELASVTAARAALRAADLRIGQVDAVTTHSAFAIEDLCFARQTGFPAERMNAHGCSLAYGHPGAPTGLRSIAELITELRLRGGGIGLFTGSAVDGTAAAVVLRADD